VDEPRLFEGLLGDIVGGEPAIGAGRRVVVIEGGVVGVVVPRTRARRSPSGDAAGRG